MILEKAIAVEREKKYKEVLNRLTIPEGLSNEDAWAKLNQRIDTTNFTPKVVPMWKKLMPYTAAAACLVLVFWFFSSDNQVTSLATDSRESVELPDGSMIYLNKYTEVSYSMDDWSENRTVNLKGEAFFEVEKGSAFTVVTDKGEVTVLGTSFNVFDREDYFEVGCFTGKVAVSHNEDKVILSPGKATELSNDALTQPMDFIGEAPDWKLNKFIFVDEALARVFEEFETEFGVKIIDESGSTAEVRINSDIVNLQSAMKQICLLADLDFEINGDEVVVTKK